MRLDESIYGSEWCIYKVRVGWARITSLDKHYMWIMYLGTTPDGVWTHASVMRSIVMRHNLNLTDKMHNAIFQVRIEMALL